MTQEQNIKITGNHIFIDAISTIIQLSSHPARFKSPIGKWLAMIAVNTMKTAIITDTKKEDAYLFINQKYFFNPADLLTKFSLEKDTPQHWM